MGRIGQDIYKERASQYHVVTSRKDHRDECTHVPDGLKIANICAYIVASTGTTTIVAKKDEEEETSRGLYNIIENITTKEYAEGSVDEEQGGNKIGAI